MLINFITNFFNSNKWKIKKEIAEFKVSGEFDPVYYLAENIDVKNSGMDPYEHYIRYGKNEGRRPVPEILQVREILKPSNKQINHNEVTFLDNVIAAESCNKSIAIVVYISELNNIDELLKNLKEIPFQFSLYIAVTNYSDEQICYKLCEDLKLAVYVNIVVVDKGLDSIVVLHDIMTTSRFQFKFFCYLHDQNEYEKTINAFSWENYYWKSLLGSSLRIKKIVSLLIQDTTGMVFPEPHYRIHEKELSHSWFKENTRSNFDKIFKDYKINKPNKYFSYPSGFMFWARVDIFREFFKTEIVRDLEKTDVYYRALWRVTALESSKKKFRNYTVSSFFSDYYPHDQTFEVNAGIFNVAIKQFIANNIYDDSFYQDTYPDLKMFKSLTNKSLLEHYLRFGLPEGRHACDSISTVVLEDALQARNVPLQCGEFNAVEHLKIYYDAALDFLFSFLDPAHCYLSMGQYEGKVQNTSALNVYLDNFPEFCKNNALVSIVIPVFNGEKYITRCLLSVFSQSLNNIEVIIVNDGSSDASQGIIESLCKNKINVKIIEHVDNLGIGKTHKDGISFVTGKYFTILDGDDWIDRYFCEYLYLVAESYDADIVSCWWTRPQFFSYPSSNKQHIKDIYILEGDALHDSIVNWNGSPNIHYGLNRKLYKTQSWLKIDPLHEIRDDIVYWEDSPVTLRFCSQINRAVCISNRIYNWYNNPFSVGNRPVDCKYVDDLICSLQYVSASFPEDSKLYVRNFENVVLYETYNRFYSLCKNNADNDTFSILKYFSDSISSHWELIPQELVHVFKVKFTSIFKLLLDELDIGISETILFVDQVGIDDLYNYVLPKFNFSINIDYVKLDQNKILSETFDDIFKGYSARIVVCSGGWSLPNFFTKRPSVQLWHGMGALKKPLPLSSSNKPNIAFCSSPDVIYAYERLFQLGKENILPYGTVQSDFFVDKQNLINLQKNFFSDYPQFAGKKIYTWCPTFRGIYPNITLPCMPNLVELSSMLNDDEIFIIKFHPIVLRSGCDLFSDKIDGLSKVFDLTDYRLPELLAATNCFMTDFSSTIFYAVLMDIPVVTYAPDIDSYSDSTGLEIDYKQTSPGEFILDTNIGSLLASLRSATSDTQKYADFKKFHLSSCDGHSAERIFAAIIDEYNKSKYLS